MARSEFDLDWKRAATSLSALIRRSNDGRWACFSDEKTRKFVHFGVDKDGGLLLHIPEEQLDQEAMNRATLYFAKFGISPAVEPFYSSHEDFERKMPAGTRIVFNMPLHHDVRRATRLAFEIFDAIYQLPEGFNLLVEEN
jgi:hypothetical protein